MDELILGFDFVEQTLLLNDSIINVLGHPECIQLRLDEENGLLMIRTCEQGEEQAVIMDPGTLEISGRSVMKKVKQLLRWNDNSPRLAYGVSLPTYNAVLFDLRDAELAVYDKEGVLWTGNA